MPSAYASNTVTLPQSGDGAIVRDCCSKSSVRGAEGRVSPQRYPNGNIDDRHPESLIEKEKLSDSSPL